MRFKEDVAPLPTMLTLGNLVCGFGAISWATMGDPSKQLLHLDYAPLNFAAYLILLAMAFDALDGFVARATHEVSVFGAELDSLADVVSFGVAPAVLARQTVLIFTGVEMIRPIYLWLCAAIFVVCTALRLARFNIETTPAEESHRHFKGLPSPAAAAVVSSLVLLHLYLGYPPAWFKLDIVTNFYKLVYEKHLVVMLLPPILVISGLLMLSTFRYTHLAHKLFAEKKDFTFIPLLLLLLLFCILFFQIVFPILSIIYLASGVVGIGLDRYLDYLDRRKDRTNPGAN